MNARQEIIVPEDQKHQLNALRVLLEEKREVKNLKIVQHARLMLIMIKVDK